MINLTISIDDVHPQKGWRILGDQTEHWLRSLHEEFGVKYTLFIPSCYHGQYPISENEVWVNELNSTGYFELAAHGHLHQTNNSKMYGECEFFEIGVDELMHRVRDIFDEWDKCYLNPIGWRSPGWLCSEPSKRYLEESFKYAAIHYEHNHNTKWDCKTFFGHDGIHQTNIGIHNVNESNPDGMIMFQSHIAGNWNDNVWNENNYNQLKHSLNYLFENYEIQCKTLNECI